MNEIRDRKMVDIVQSRIRVKTAHGYGFAIVTSDGKTIAISGVLLLLLI